MNFAKKIITKKLIIVFVIFVLAFQPIIAFAEDVVAQEPPPVVEETPPSAPSGDGSAGDSTIVTGDAGVEIGVTNDVNQNEVGNNPNPADAQNDPADQPTETNSETPADNLEPLSSGHATTTSEEQIPPPAGPENSTSSEELVLPDLPTKTSSSSGDVYLNTNKAGGENIIDGSGVSGENGAEPNSGSTTIETGNINIDSTLENNVNKNNLDLECFDCENSQATSSLFSVENNNDSNMNNGVSLTATSGDNIIKDSGGDGYIGTGDIGIVSLIINFINTNFIGDGKKFFVNIFDKVSGSLDLSGYGDTTEELKDFGGCSDSTCQLNIENNSTSTLENTVDIDVNTGSNIIATTTGDGVIETGDIDIVNDILNITNLNVSGNDWFFAVVNIFGEMDGNVVLPAFKQVIDNPEASSTKEAEATSTPKENVDPEVSSEFILSNQNEQNLLNEINTNLNTGDNDVSGDGLNVIDTGDIESQIKTLNLVNYNIAGDFWKFARINIFGSWEGIINGLPPEYSYYEDENSVIVYNKFLDDPALNKSYAQLAVDNSNVGTTTNEININADTGDNSILHQEDYGLIKTGYIKIKNSLLNFLNSNFAGNNWEFSMINVFGDWNGNLDFGQPELWINVSSNKTETANEGDLVTYTFIYGNNGDSTATDVVVVDDFNEGALDIAEAGGGEVRDGIVAWDLGDVPPNSQGSFSYTTQVKNLPAGNHTIKDDSRILSKETDRDTSNNSSSVSFMAYGGATATVRAVSSSRSSLPSLSIVKTNNASDVVHPGDVVDYKLVIRNNGSKDALEVYVLDVMSNIDTDEEIHRDFWDLGTVHASEEVVIEYSLEISEAIESGTYINEATIEGYDPNRQMYISAIGSSRNKIINDIEPGEPAIVVSRVTRSTYANPGDLIDFEIIVANNGRGEAQGVEITEILPDYLSYSDTGGNIGYWNFDVINPGEIKNIKYSIAVSDKATEGFYESGISLVGANIDSEYLTEYLEVREVKVLALFSGEESPLDNGSVVVPATVNRDVESDRKNLPENYNKWVTSDKEIVNDDSKRVGQVLGVSDDSDRAGLSYMFYVWIAVLIIALVMFLLWFILLFREDDREKLS